MLSWFSRILLSKEDKKSKDLEDIYFKCTQENTYVLGFAGSGKSTFLNRITRTLYNNNKSYIMCGNSISQLNEHFHKHGNEDEVFIFMLDGEKTHSIDIDYLFSLDSFLNYVCLPEKIEELKYRGVKRWLPFFTDKNNEIYFKDGMFDFIFNLISHGYIEEKGSLSEVVVQGNIYIYVVLDKNAKFRFTVEEKQKYLTLLNFIQIAVNRSINVIFDEESIFFKSDEKTEKKLIMLSELNNIYLFTAQLLYSFDNYQLVCFKSYFQSDFFDLSQHDKMEIKSLRVGEFFFFDKFGHFIRNKKFRVDFDKLKKEEKDISHFINNKQKKLHDFLQKDLNKIKEVIVKKISKI